MNLPTTIENNVVDVDHALKEWRAYQRLCKELLDDSDYQEYTQKDKKTGPTIVGDLKTAKEARDTFHPEGQIYLTWSEKTGHTMELIE